ncbi:MAG TPA: DUF4270 domain-containing protein [Bacteroides sp.]|nr:DUF4270 domain-containing protein [Bacteroides sp.]
MKKKDLWVHALFMIMVFAGWSCQVTDQELGTDLLPPDDDVFLFRDTIFEINSYPVSGQPLMTHERGEAGRLFLLGATRDSIVGTSKASLLTHFNPTLSFKNGPNLVIDSLVFYLHIPEFKGDTTARITIRVHELTERIYRDSVYYSNFVTEGKYNPVPLAEYSYLPRSNNTYPFFIDDPAYLDKFYDLQTDTGVFRNDSLFKDVFRGFYIEAESVSERGVMAGVQLNNALSKVAIKYASDSTEVDSTAGQDFIWTNFAINEFSSQKINVFEHDHSGTYLAGIIDRAEADARYCYVQGMSGVNTRISFPTLPDWIGKGPVVISSATLIFDVVPEAESGIPPGTMPDRLMVLTELDPGKYQELYDYIALRQIDNAASRFGGYLKPVSAGMFADTTYSYKFNVTLHFQAMVNEEKLENNFILQVSNARSNPEITKLWSSHPANIERLRLEVVYLKL